jgi:hypothetical protein
MNKNLKIVYDVYMRLSEKDKPLWLAQLHPLFESQRKMFSGGKLEGVPCFANNVRRHRLDISCQVIWQHPHDIQNKIVRLFRSSSHTVKVPDLPCCSNFWNREIASSSHEDSWIVFWNFEFNDWPRSAQYSFGQAQGEKRYTDPLFLFNYERKSCYGVQSGSCRNLAKLWQYVV